MGDRWTPAPGQVFTDGWVPFPTGANFAPCQKVTWFFDRAGEPANATRMREDVIQSFDRLEPLTGLDFSEAATAQDADVLLRWADLKAERDKAGHVDPALADASSSALGSGVIRFDALGVGEGLSDEFAGWGLVQLYYEGQPWYQSPGRQYVVVHEIMHLLGFDHTTDTKSVMYVDWSNDGRGDFSAGDIAGLRTMYLERPCPAPFQTCMKPKSGAKTCTSGLDWSYEYCWQGAEGAVVQQWINRKWKTIKRGISQKDSCDSGYPWTVQFEHKATGPGTVKYRIYIPAGQYRAAIEPITVTVTPISA